MRKRIRHIAEDAMPFIKPFGLTLLCALGVSGCGTELDTDASATGDEIVGGTNDSGHPAVGLIQMSLQGAGGLISGNASCTGTLVSPTVILSAAHCVKQRDPTWGELTVTSARAYFGPDVSTAAASEFKTVSGWHAHPSYTSGNVEDPNDIGVFVLSEAAGINPMPFHRSTLGAADVGQAVVSVGYGRTSGANTASAGVKRMVTSSLVSVSSNGKHFTHGAAGSSTCQGDSGGPELMMRGGVETIVGVTSFGPNPCESGPATAVRTDAHLSFIDQYVNGGGTTGGGGGGTGGSGGTIGGSSCCINGRCYSCPNDAALQRCVGFDLNACFAGCSGNLSCLLNCQSRASSATRDPSACTPR